jgi:hypothetical protein
MTNWRLSTGPAGNALHSICEMRYYDKDLRLQGRRARDEGLGRPKPETPNAPAGAALQRMPWSADSARTAAPGPCPAVRWAQLQPLPGLPSPHHTNRASAVVHYIRAR